ncbi:MAG: oligosaccharide flippase family protein [Sphingobium sp.]
MNRSSVIWSVVRNWGQRLGSVITFFILVRLLTQEEIAIFAAAAAVMALLDLFTDNGLGDAMVQAKDTPAPLSTALFLINVAIACILYAGVLLFADPIAALLGVDQATNVLMVAASVLLLNSLSFAPQAMMRKQFQFKRLAMRSLAATLLSAATGIIMAFAGLGVWAMVGQLLVFSAVSAAMAWYPPVLRLARPDFRGVRPLISFGSKIFASRVLYYSSTRIISILLSIFFGPIALALYYMAVRLPAVLGQLLVTVVTDLGLPQFSKLADDQEALANAFFSNLVFAAGISVPAFFALGALAPEITVLAFGANGEGSAALLLPLALASAFQSVGTYNQIILNSRGMSGVSFWLSLANTTITTTIFFLARNTDLYTFINIYTASQICLIPLYFYVGGLYSGISFGRLLRVVYPYFTSATVALAAVWLARPLMRAEIPGLSDTPLIQSLILGCLLGLVFLFAYIALLILLDRKAAIMIGKQFLVRRRRKQA